MRQPEDNRQEPVSRLPFTGRELLLCGLLVLVYLLTAKGYLAVSDSGYSLRTARALVERGTFAIPVFPGDHGYIYQAADGRAYAKYGIGLPLLWVPPVIAAKFLARAAVGDEDFIIDFVLSFVNILFGAALAVIFYRIIRRLHGGPHHALRLALILGLCTLCWRYSVWDFSEIVQAFCLLAAVDGLLGNTRHSILFAGAAMAAMVTLKLFSLIYVPALAAYLVVRNRGNGGRPIAAAVRLLLPLLLVLLLLAGANWLRFADPLESGYGGEVRQFRAKFFAGNFLHLLFLPAQGIFVYAPVLIMGVAAWPAFFRRHRREALLALALVLSNFLPLSFWHAVVGSWSWGPRWLVPVLPLWLLPMLIFLQQRRWLRLTALLVALSLLIQLVGVLQNEHEYHTLCAAAAALDPAIRMPPDIIGCLTMLGHKLRNDDHRYALAEFGLADHTVISTGHTGVYFGLNLWYLHLARTFQQPGWLLAPLLILLLLPYFISRLLRPSFPG